MMKETRFFKNMRAISLVLIISFFIPIVLFSQVEIIGTLSNWDAHNLMKDELPVDNFELEFHGKVKKTDIIDIYYGRNCWGTPVKVCEYPGGKGTEITWFDRVHPINYCETRHFGVDLRHPRPFGQIGASIPEIEVQAYWPRIDKELIAFPVPSIYAEGYSDEWSIFIFLPYRGKLSALIDSVAYARTHMAFTLEDLKWNFPAEWKSLESPIKIEGSMGKDYMIKAPKEPGAIQLQYSVASLDDPKNPYAYVNFQFVIDTIQYGGLGIVSFDLNFSLHNTTDRPKDNLEFDWIGLLRKEDIKSFYEGEDAWGLRPRVQEFDYGSLPEIDEHPIEGGLEITWMDKCNPLEPCHWAHFGFSTGVSIYPGILPTGGWYCSDMLYYIFLYWTEVVKVAEVPIPWQWWQIDSDDPIIRDVIQYGSSYEDNIGILRQFAVIPEPFTLDSLHFDPGEDATGKVIEWKTVDDKLLEMKPGGTEKVDIEVKGKMYGAVLVRYEVFGEDNPQVPVARIINQAEFYDPKPGTGVEINTSLIPDQYTLSQNYPNPFNMETTFEVGLPKGSRLKVEIFNLLGQRVRTVFDDSLPIGTHTFKWDGLSDAGEVLPSSVYLCSMQAKGFTKTVKMLLSK